MPFNLPEFRVPKSLQTKDFMLRPICAADARLDYEAIMESREFLRLWEQSSWPEDGFTEEENREDLVKLEQRHATQDSFTYTVMNQSETQCLGCVYIFPMDAGMFSRSIILSCDGTEWSDCSAAVYFWVRASILAVAFDRKLLDALCSWLEFQWRFKNFLFIMNEEFGQQVDMIEDAGLQQRFRIDDPKASDLFLAYGARSE